MCSLIFLTGCGFPAAKDTDDAPNVSIKDTTMEFIETKTYDTPTFSLDIPVTAKVLEDDDIYTISYEEGVLKVGPFDPYTEVHDGKGLIGEYDLPKDVLYYDDAGMASALYYDATDGLVKAQLLAMQESLLIK